jgi:hypothetical protein
MSPSTFLIRAITLHPVTSPPLVSDPFVSNCGEEAAIAPELASLRALGKTRDRLVRRKTKPKRKDRKGLVIVLVGVSSLILTTQLTLVTFEQLSPLLISQPTPGSIQTYLPPDLGSPARTFGSATR